MEVVTKEQAQAAREQYRAYLARVKAEKAARKSRREERAEEIARHREAEAKAQTEIDEARKALAFSDSDIGHLKTQIYTLQESLCRSKDNRMTTTTLLQASYADRQAARDALRKLHAEILGRDGEGVQQ